MARTAPWQSAALVMASLVEACAHAPVYMSGTWEHPRMQAIVCDVDKPTSLVNVSVTDALGTAIPGAAVYLLAKAATPEVTTGVSDQAGKASLARTGSGVHVVVAVMPGFDLDWHTVLLEPGCRGQVNMVLRVASGPR
jgi:hypothetical protein